MQQYLQCYFYLTTFYSCLGSISVYQANVTQMGIEFGHSIDGKHYCSVPAAYHYHSLHGGEKLMVGNLMTALVPSYQQHAMYYLQ